MEAPTTGSEGFVPPPYPHDRLTALRRLADAMPGGVVDCSVGTPVDPMPDVAVRALTDAVTSATGYPPSIGTPALREAAAAWIGRRFDVEVEADGVIACVGTKELVASLPHVLHLRNPTRDTVLFPAIAYPTYEMGARLAGLRPVPVPLDTDWCPDLDRIGADDADRTLLLWLNDPGNPTGASMGSERVAAVVAWARERGIVVAGDECYAEFTADAGGKPADPTTVLQSGLDGVLAVHSLSKRSNMAGLRAGFVAGDPELVRYLGEVRKHAGLMVPAPVQAAAAAALGDDAHVDDQRARYAERRALVLDALGAHGIVHDGGPSTFYLWLRGDEGMDDGWELAARFADAGTLVAPGDLYGPAGADHVRLSLTQPLERLELLVERFDASAQRGVVAGSRLGKVGPMSDLEQTITALWDGRDDLDAVMPRAEAEAAVRTAIDLLDTGEARVAELTGGEVVVHQWLKQAILLLFRLTSMTVEELGPFEYRDKIPLKHDYEGAGVRVVPGASARWGAYLAPGVILMPSYTNIGARVGADTMVDTWATVGSCAQIGERVHLSGGVGIGGVLEPPNAAPVMIGDDTVIGSRCIVAEGATVGNGVVLGAGCILTGSIPVIDAETGAELGRGAVPDWCVAVSATRPRSFPGGDFGLPCVLVVKRLTEGERHDKAKLNDVLREHGAAT